MTKTIVFVNTKGGTGKTTSTICIATALAGMREVVVWDADIQGSSTEWAEQAAAAGQPLPFDVDVVNMVKLKGNRKPAVDYVLVDTPPGHTDVVDAAIAAADFVILPSSPAVIDLDRMLATATSIPANIPYAALITRANKQTVAYKTATQFLRENSVIPIFSQAIGDRQAIQNSFGSRPEIFYDYSAVTDELLEVME